MGNRENVIHTSIKPDGCFVKETSPNLRPEISKTKLRKKVDFSERLLRNTAIACMLLLGILTLRNIDAPWSQAAVNGIETALTMRIDPDSTLGDLSFVRSFLPESTLVFFNMSSEGPLDPVEGEIIHEYLEGQPWIMFAAEPGSSVRSVLAGTVSAVSCMESGDWCVLIDHGDGVETVYAYIEKPAVDAGDKIARGEQIGTLRSERLYYEYRLNGESIAPGGENTR